MNDAIQEAKVKLTVLVNKGIKSDEDLANILQTIADYKKVLQDEVKLINDSHAYYMIKLLNPELKK